MQCFVAFANLQNIRRLTALCLCTDDQPMLNPVRMSVPTNHDAGGSADPDPEGSPRPPQDVNDAIGAAGADDPGPRDGEVYDDEVDGSIEELK